VSPFAAGVPVIWIMRLIAGRTCFSARQRSDARFFTFDDSSSTTTSYGQAPSSDRTSQGSTS